MKKRAAEIWVAKVRRAFEIMELAEHSDYATDDELNEIISIAPYNRKDASYKQ